MPFMTDVGEVNLRERVGERIKEMLSLGNAISIPTRMSDTTTLMTSSPIVCGKRDELVIEPSEQCGKRQQNGGEIE